MERYDYGDYFSIKDTVAWINSYVMVKVVLNIVSETKEGKQRPYHSEIVSHKKSGNSGLTMMRDLSNCYLSIESRKTVNGNHGFAMIRNSSMSPAPPGRPAPSGSARRASAPAVRRRELASTSPPQVATRRRQPGRRMPGTACR